MKKRKTPILLLSILLVLVGGGVVVGMSQAGDDKPKEPTPEPISKGSAGPDDKTVEAVVAGATGKATAKGPGGPKGPPVEAPAGPTIAVKKGGLIFPKPKPNPNGSTSSQWYNH